MPIFEVVQNEGLMHDSRITEENTYIDDIFYYNI